MKCSRWLIISTCLRACFITTIIPAQQQWRPNRAGRTQHIHKNMSNLFCHAAAFWRQHAKHSPDMLHPSIHTKAHVRPHPYTPPTHTHTHAHSWTREAQPVIGAKDVRIIETNIKLTSIFLPSTIVPCSLSRAFSASALFSNVTKPKPWGTTVTASIRQNDQWGTPSSGTRCPNSVNRRQWIQNNLHCSIWETTDYEDKTWRKASLSFMIKWTHFMLYVLKKRQKYNSAVHSQVSEI